MRRLFVLAALLAIVCYGKAQNVQLHYDFGGALYDKDLHGRPVLTSTVEMFKADKWGSTYFFVDMDYTSKGVAAGYWEIARELRFWQPPFSIHVEYNGGASNSFSYNNAYLGGATYTWNNPDFTKGFTLTSGTQQLPVDRHLVCSFCQERSLHVQRFRRLVEGTDRLCGR